MNRIKEKIPLVLLWLCLTSTAPFIFYSWPGHPYKLLTFFCIVFMLFQMLMNLKVVRFDITIIFIAIIQVVFYLFSTLYHNDLSDISNFFQVISLIIIIIYIRTFIEYKSFVKSYVWIILLMGIGGTVTFFIHLLVGIKPIFTVNYSETGISYFLGLTSTNVYFNSSSIRIIRFSGFFDEPGAFGLYSLFAIILNRIYFQNSKIEKALIFVTIFTMSLAFYISIFFYFLLFFLNKYNVKYLILIAGFIGVSFFIISANKNNATYEKLYAFTFKRLEMNDRGLVENGRTSRMEHDKEIFYRYPLFGAGFVNEQIKGANLYSAFAHYGIIGCFFYYIFLIYYLFLIIKLRWKKRLFYTKIYLLILLTFYHRPELSSVLTLLVFIFIIYHIKYEVEHTSQNIYENLLLLKP
jgi:hypothetical protein